MATSTAAAALLGGVTAANCCCTCGALYGLKMYVDGAFDKDKDEKRRSSGRGRKAPVIIREASSSDEGDASSNVIVMPKPGSRRNSSSSASGNNNGTQSRRGSKQTVANIPPELEAMEAGWQGFSMEEARRLADANHELAASLSPQEVLSVLQKGNMRFWTGAATRPEKSAFERRALISKQFPLAAVLSCSDSRVPTEIVFDVGLGDMFVIRVAGNCLDTAALASLQYAIKHLKVKVVLVMGHEGCGAVKAAGMSSEDINKEPHALARLLNGLKGGLEHGRLQGISDPRAYDREAVVTNVKRQIEQLASEETVMEKVASNEILCVGAFYEISSGIVDFFSELTVKDACPLSPSRGKISRGVSGTLEVQFKKH